MTLWVGIDDTDSPQGGCTTFVLTELLALAREQEVDVIGEPRLVRLNPNIPWKTRGNAALAARFGRGEGRRRTLGEIRGNSIHAFPRGRPLSIGKREEFLEAAWKTVLGASRLGERGTDPALVATTRPLPASIYWQAVREVVAVADLKADLARSGAWYRTRGTDRGLVGAAASVAWPARRVTWEVIAYREPARYGQPRDVGVESVRAAQAAHPGLFLCYDSGTRRLLVAPHTPCPILFGLRGTVSSAPLRARPTIQSEPVERWVLFRTNQGTGDHLTERAAEGWAEHLSGSFRGHVVGMPERVAGGHARFEIANRGGVPVPCVAFEPTKTLPRLAQELRPGDEVRVWGSQGREPGLRVEGIEVLRWNPTELTPSPPSCPKCRRGTRSLGRQRGYQCPNCHQRWPPEAAVRRARSPPRPLGTYHPTASARRHLAPRGPET